LGRESRASLETCASNRGRAGRATSDCEADLEGIGHTTILVATNRTKSSDAVELSGSGKPKLYADRVGGILIEAVSADTAPLASSRDIDVDVALEVAESTGKSDSSG